MGGCYIQYRDGQVYEFLGPNARTRAREFARKANALVGEQSWAGVVSVVHVKGAR